MYSVKIYNLSNINIKDPVVSRPILSTHTLIVTDIYDLKKIIIQQKVL